MKAKHEKKDHRSTNFFKPIPKKADTAKEDVMAKIKGDKETRDKDTKKPQKYSQKAIGSLNEWMGDEVEGVVEDIHAEQAAGYQVEEDYVDDSTYSGDDAVSKGPSARTLDLFFPAGFFEAAKNSEEVSDEEFETDYVFV